jgi:hypothetical protein
MEEVIVPVSGIFYCLTYSSSLMIEAINSCETVNICQAAQQDASEDLHLY